MESPDYPIKARDKSCVFLRQESISWTTGKKKQPQAERPEVAVQTEPIIIKTFPKSD
jgi:hypothetical protein